MASMACFSSSQCFFICADCALSVASSSWSASSRSREASSLSLSRATCSIFKLQDATLDDVDLGRHRVDLDPQTTGGLVDQVDGLIGQEAIGQIPIGEHCGTDQRGILDPHTVMHPHNAL
jgi:hypothetical protein